jgi:mannose-1-phosphate guanylyltransferase
VAPKAVVGLFPTDHLIPDEAAFGRSVSKAIESARDGGLVCLGIRPDRPATGFGYLKCAERPRAGRASRVERFVEKPDSARARAFLRSGRYLWNGGMFVWGVKRFTDELGRTAPRILRAVQRFRGGESAAWERAPRLSIDYALMEKARDVRVVPLAAGWNDVGSWDAAAAVVEAGRSKMAEELLVDSPGSVVFGGERIVAVVDVPDVAVVDTPDALLIVSRRSSEKVREIVARLKRRGRSDLL